MSLEATDWNLHLARLVYVNHVGHGTNDFTFKDAMILVGIHPDIAASPFYQRKLEHLISRGNSSRFHLQSDRDSMHQRFETLASILYFIDSRPPCHNFNAKVMKMAGFPKEATSKGADCQKCYRYKKKLMKMKKEGRQPDVPSSYEPPPPPIVPITIDGLLLPPVVTMEDDNDSTNNRDSLSPLSMSTGTGTTRRGRRDEQSNLFDPPFRPTTEARKKVSPQESSVISAVSSTTSSSRRTSKQKQNHRKEVCRNRRESRMVQKFASAWWKEVNATPKFLDRPETAEETALMFNNIFGVEAVTAAFLNRSLANRTCDQLPPPDASTSILPLEDFTNLCHLCWTCEALEQSNVSSTRLNRVQMKDLIDRIVNGKIEDENACLREGEEKKATMNSRWLWERIETENSLVQDVIKVDPRVERRVVWTTFRNQTMHYEASERILVAKGYADWPKDDAERALKGYVVFRPGQMHRYINIDEMRLTLDGGSEQPGGRQAMTHSTDGVHEAGKSDRSKDAAVTLLLGITGANEALPVFVIFPTLAAAGNGRMRFGILETFEQIKARYGFSKDRYFDCVFAVSPKGSMTKEIMPFYFETMREWFPDCQDRDGYRNFLKLDTGPGRTSSNFLAQSRVEGFDIFPGLPNGTEMGQEMDQLFGPFKQILYDNRDRIIAKHNKISFEDIGTMIFGGNLSSEDIELNDNEVLPNAYVEAFTAEKIQVAREKCGYCPATRNALRHPKIRSEIPVGVEDQEDSLEDPMIENLLLVEKINHDAVKYLEQAGYRHASEAKRDAIRVRETNVGFGRSVTTEPNTAERRELLSKCRYAGDYFHVSGGGMVYNSADMLQVLNDKVKETEAAEATKRKKHIEDFEPIIDQAKKLNTILYKNWKKDDFVTAIKYKLGPIEASARGNGTSGKSKKALEKWYEEKFKGHPTTWTREQWTSADERNLESLLSNEATEVEELTIYGRGVERQNELLVTSFLSANPQRFEDILRAVFSKLPEGRRRRILASLTGNEDHVVGENGSDDNSEFENTMEPDENALEQDHNDDDDFTLIELEQDPNATETQNTSDGTATPAPASNIIEASDRAVNNGAAVTTESPLPVAVIGGPNQDDDSSSDDGISFKSGSLGGDDLLSSGRDDLLQNAVIDTEASRRRIQEIQDILAKHNRLHELYKKYCEHQCLTVEDYKFLISSRGGSAGRARTLKGLLKKWKHVENDPKVWTENVDALEDELFELTKQG